MSEIAYRKWTRREAATSRNQMAARSSGGNLLKLQDRNLLRFLPTPATPEWDLPEMDGPFYVGYQHFFGKGVLPGSDPKRATVFVCPDVADGGTTCPSCAYGAALEGSRHREHQEAAWDYRRSPLVLGRAVSMTTPELGPRLVRVPVGVYRELNSWVDQELPEANFWDPHDGFPLTITRYQENGNTRYRVSANTRDAGPIDPTWWGRLDAVSDLLREVPPLPGASIANSFRVLSGQFRMSSALPERGGARREALGSSGRSAASDAVGRAWDEEETDGDGFN